MSHTRTDRGESWDTGEASPVLPRVRHLAREALGLMAFSALASTTLAGCLLLLTMLGHQG